MAETKWTKEQLKAITTRNCNLLVAAAAGSGKTAVLVERIIRMITDKERPIDIDKLLVVTFTNAAAAEMRERIGEAISKELDRFPDSKVLQRQLTLLNKSNITTMHSFCLDVIKNNFHHIELDPNFRIADETEAILLKQEVIQELFENKYEEEDNESFLSLVECFGSSRDDIYLQNIVNDLYDFSMSGPWPEKWLKEKAEDFNIDEDFDIGNSIWGKNLKESIDIELYGMKEKLLSALSICESYEGLDKYGENIKDDLNIIEDLQEALNLSFDELYKSFNGLAFSKLNRCGKDADKEAQKRVKDLRDEVKKRINSIKEEIFNISPEDSVKSIKDMYPIIKALTELVIEFNHRYRQKKAERGILDFNDLEHLCLDILTERDERGYIVPSKASLGFREKFEEVLVDEYQDSNSVQETIINMVSRKNTDAPNVFMVGDIKQSIYRFRQAKPELFLDKYINYSEKEGDKNRKILLYKNFRSRIEVIDAVNYIFKQLMSETVGELQYDDKEALNLGADYKILEEQGSKAGGDIELHIINLSGKDIEKEDEDLNENSEEEENLDEEELDKIQIEARFAAKRIKEMINPSTGEVFKVYDRGLGDYRPVKYKDIVILMRTTANWASVFMEELSGEGIPVYADAGTGYFQTVEIRTMMALLQVIDNPLQDIPLLSVLRSPIFSFTPEELIDLRIYDREKYFYESLKEIAQSDTDSIASQEDYKYEKNLKEKCKYVIYSIERWRENSLHMPIDEFIWYLYTDTSYYGYVRAMPNGMQRQANLRILFQRAKQYEETSFKGLFNFINFINKLRKNSGDMGSAKILGENEDVVRIMSIHKSKGLEFPVVILAGCGKNFNLMDLNKPILFHEQLGFGPDYVDYKKRITYATLAKQALKKKFKIESLSEEMRILYVALTRAKEKLIITGSVADIEKACLRWCSASSDSIGKISSQEVLKGKNYMDWIGMAMAKHKNGKIIRDYVEASADINHSDLSTWNIKIWDKNNIIVDKNILDVDKINEKDKVSLKETNNEDYIQKIKNRLDWVYDYKYSSIIPANISVSELKREQLQDEAQDNAFNIFKQQTIKKPQFLQDKKGLSGAERGTAVHFMMQHIDLSKVKDIEEVKKQLDYLVIKEYLTYEEVKAVNPEKIIKFFQSDLGQRILNCYNTTGKIYRETPFYIEIPSTLVKKELPKDIYYNEKVRLQGVIDCFFEEEGEIVLLDYKTDYVGEGGIEEIKNRYKVQIEYYEDALKRITGKKIKEKYLYLFYNGEIVKM